MNYLSLIFYIFVLIFCLGITRSIIAPLNVFIVFIGLFFSSVFFNEHSALIYFIYFTILFVVLFHNVVIFKFIRQKYYEKVIHDLVYPRVLFCFSWLLILAVLFVFISKFGGFQGFVIASKRGTEEFYGLGHFKTMINFIYPLGLLSYTFYSFGRIKYRWDKLINILIQFTVLFVAFLSLSRGTILNYIISIFIIRHTLGYRISRITYLMGPLLAMVFASFLGVVRETLNFDDNKFSLGIENTNSKYKTEWMEFGTYPLEQINLSHTRNKPSLGLTYLTAVTNLVPRNLWPGKPDPGGVVFTRDYTDGIYDEYNQYSTGIFPEAMINFGLIGGYIFGTVFFFALLSSSSYIYYRYFTSYYPLSKVQNLFVVVFYSYIFMSLPALMTAEFTNVVTALILKFLTLSIFYFLSKLKFNYER